MAAIEILLRLPAGLAQAEVVERLGAEGMTDCACGLGLPGHVALAHEDAEQDTSVYAEVFALAVAAVVPEADIVRVSMPAIGLDWRLPE